MESKAWTLSSPAYQLCRLSRLTHALHHGMDVVGYAKPNSGRISGEGKLRTTGQGDFVFTVHLTRLICHTYAVII